VKEQRTKDKRKKRKEMEETSSLVAIFMNKRNLSG